MKIKRLIARLYDLPNAYRVLDIMDHAGCDIVAPDNADDFDMWQIRPKWYVSLREATDLRDIVLHKSQFRYRSKVGSWIFYHMFFPAFRPGSRVLDKWIKGDSK